MPAINLAYSETTSGHATSAQAEFNKLFVKIVCTAFAVCTTTPPKNILTFEVHMKYESKSSNVCLRENNKPLYDDLQVFIEYQIEKMSNVMICEITQYR